MHGAGAATLTAGEIGGPSPAWRCVRPLWLVAALNIATLNAYSLYWFFATWRELKSERCDPSMRPAWHAFSMLGPIHGIVQFHSHMRVIGELARSSGVRTPFSPTACVLVWLITTLVGLWIGALKIQGAEVPYWTNLAVITSQVPLLVWAQATLNATWRALPQGAPRYRIRRSAWILMATGTLFQLLPLAGFAAP